MGLIVIVVIGVLIVAAIFWVMSLYNGLVVARNAYKNAFAQIDVQLTRRHDLIPNLVETVKAYLQHERGTLEAVIKARNDAISGLNAAKQHLGEPGAMAELGRSQDALGGALGRLMVTVEAYPELKANQNMLQLNEELASTENRVAFARQAYNDSVMSYNNKREIFPSNIFAGMFQFAPAALLEIASTDAHKREVPKVQF